MLMHNKTQRKMLTSPFSLFEKKKHFATSKNTLKNKHLAIIVVTKWDGDYKKLHDPHGRFLCIFWSSSHGRLIRSHALYMHAEFIVCYFADPFPLILFFSSNTLPLILIAERQRNRLQCSQSWDFRRLTVVLPAEVLNCGLLISLKYQIGLMYFHWFKYRQI